MEIKLQKGFFCLIDDADAAIVSNYKWYAKRCGGGVPNDERYYVVAPLAKGKRLTMHRLLMGITGLSHTVLEVDHINHNGLDNRRENLRLATRSQNQRNAKHKSFYGRFVDGAKRPCNSQYKGVRRVPTGWQARIWVNGKRLSLGYYRTEIEAGLAYRKAATKYFGEFAFY